MSLRRRAVLLAGLAGAAGISAAAPLPAEPGPMAAEIARFLALVAQGGTSSLTLQQQLDLALSATPPDLGLRLEREAHDLGVSARDYAAYALLDALPRSPVLDRAYCPAAMGCVVRPARGQPALLGLACLPPAEPVRWHADGQTMGLRFGGRPGYCLGMAPGLAGLVLVSPGERRLRQGTSATLVLAQCLLQHRSLASALACLGEVSLARASRWLLLDQVTGEAVAWSSAAGGSTEVVEEAFDVTHTLGEAGAANAEAVWHALAANLGYLDPGKVVDVLRRALPGAVVAVVEPAEHRGLLADGQSRQWWSSSP